MQSNNKNQSNTPTPLLTRQKGLINILSQQLLCIHDMVKVLIHTKKCNSSWIMHLVSFACKNGVFQRLGTAYEGATCGGISSCAIKKYAWWRFPPEALSPSRQKFACNFHFSSQIWCNFHCESSR
jgi:hypothetical protein